MNADQLCALLAIRELSVQLLCELPNENPLHDRARTLARRVGTIARDAMPQEHIAGVDEAKRRCEKRYDLGRFKLGRPLPRPRKLAVGTTCYVVAAMDEAIRGSTSVYKASVVNSKWDGLDWTYLVRLANGRGDRCLATKDVHPTRRLAIQSIPQP